MWVTADDFTKLVEKFKKLLEQKVAELPQPKNLVTCATCRIVFEPRSMYYMSLGYATDEQVRKRSTTNYSQTHCDRCAPAEAAKQQAANWAMNNPDQAKECMEKHTKRGAK
jgi:hypothetical protein